MKKIFTGGGELTFNHNTRQEKKKQKKTFSTCACAPNNCVVMTSGPNSQRARLFQVRQFKSNGGGRGEGGGGEEGRGASVVSGFVMKVK